MRPRVSVVVPTYNRWRALLRCLESLPDDVEKIVIDDGSTDRTRTLLSELKSSNLICKSQVNQGPAAARNQGIVLASGDIVAFTDDDCVPRPGWPWPLADRLSARSPEVAGVGGRVLPLRDSLVARYSTFHGILDPPPSCAYLVTANCAYRRAALVSVRGFDERIGEPGGEDPELSARLRRLGYRFEYEPNAIVMHEYRTGLWEFARTFHRYGKGCAHVLGT